MLSRRLAFLILPLLSIVVCAAAQREGGPPPADDKYLGLWSGSWEGGGGSGGFDLTLERDKDKNLIGNVSVTGEPTYKATLASVAFDGAKMTARYDFPPDPQAEVAVAATFEGNGATGTWSLREKGTGNEVANGSWKVTRKDKQIH